MFVLDTNVLSEAMKAAPAPAVARWMLREPRSFLFTTAACEAELLLGIALKQEGRRKSELETSARRVLGLFAGKILPFDSSAAIEFARIAADRRKLGRPIEHFDAQIATIALAQGMRLVNRDVSDFEHTGVSIVDPWAAP